MGAYPPQGYGTGAGAPPGLHAPTHGVLGLDAVALDASQTTTGRFGMPRMPDAAAGNFIKSAGVGVDPAYAALAAADILSGRFGMPRMPDGVATRVLTAQGAGVDPAYAALPAAADTRGRTIVVAASNSINVTLAPVAYRCDGAADQVEINAAITALGATGGTVMLLEGTYAITASINLATLTTLMGQGAGTILRVPNAFSADLKVISASNVNRVIVADLRINGNKTNQAAGAMHGIFFHTVTYSTIARCWVENMYIGRGIYLDINSNNNMVTGNTCQLTDHGDGIYFDTCNNNIITGNNCQSNDYNGLTLDNSDYNTVTGNNCQSNLRIGLRLVTSSDSNTVTGNTVVGNSQDADNTYDGMFIENSDYNNIQGNTVRHLGGAKQHRYGINISNASCDGNLVINNDLYLAGKTKNLNDAGTGTIERDNRGWVTENNVLSPSFAIDAIAVVTVTIPHGCNVTPAAQACQLTVVEDTDVDDWGYDLLKVESVGAVNVVAKIHVSTASATAAATAKLLLHVDLARG